MQWKVILEGTDEFGSTHRSEFSIDKDLVRASAGEIGLSVEDGKAIATHLQQAVVKQQCEAYVLTSRFCMDCDSFRRIKDYGKRKIRTVFGCVEVRSPRIMNCQRCLPHFGGAWSVLADICPYQATPELMERSARLGALLPYRKAAQAMAEFLPLKPSESFVTLRHRTLKLGQRRAGRGHGLLRWHIGVAERTATSMAAALVVTTNRFAAWGNAIATNYTPCSTIGRAWAHATL